MAEARRSLSTLVPLAGAVLLLAAALLMPWFEFTHSTGTQNPQATGSPTGDPDRQVERQHAAFYPFRVEGDANATRDVDAEDEVQVLGLLAAGGLGLATVALAIETFWGGRIWSRRVAIPIALTGIVLVLGALAWAWVALPDTLAHRGVDRFFTSRRGEEGFIRTTASWGWLAAAASLFGLAAYAATKYAGGPIEVTEIEATRRQDAGDASKFGGQKP